MGKKRHENTLYLLHWAHDLGAKDGDDCATVITEGMARLQSQRPNCDCKGALGIWRLPLPLYEPDFA